MEFFMALGLFFCRGIFKLLVKFQLENKDNPSYTGKHMLKTSKCCTDFPLWFHFCFLSLCAGLSFQDFYQRCREAFLVNSDLTLRTQLTEFRDHKLIRTRKVESCLTLEFPTLIQHHNPVQPPGSLTYIYSLDSPGCRWSGVLDGCCGREHADGFPGERGGWLRREGFGLISLTLYWLTLLANRCFGRISHWSTGKAKLHLISIKHEQTLQALHTLNEWIKSNYWWNVLTFHNSHLVFWCMFSINTCN